MYQLDKVSNMLLYVNIIEPNEILSLHAQITLHQIDTAQTIANQDHYQWGKCSTNQDHFLVGSILVFNGLSGMWYWWVIVLVANGPNEWW